MFMGIPSTMFAQLWDSAWCALLAPSRLPNPGTNVDTENPVPSVSHCWGHHGRSSRSEISHFLVEEVHYGRHLGAHYGVLTPESKTRRQKKLRFPACLASQPKTTATEILNDTEQKGFH